MRTAAWVALAAIAACGHDPAAPADPTPTPSRDREPAIRYRDGATAGERLATLLAAVHGPLPEALLQSRWELRDENGETAGVSLSVPGRMRMDLPTGGYLLVSGDRVRRVRFDGEGVRRPEPVDDELAARLRLFEASLEAMVLAPLHGAEAIEEGAEGGLEFDGRGRRWRLELGPSGVPALLRAEGDPEVAVTFDEWVAPTARTLVPRRVTFAGIGTRTVSVDAAAVEFDEGYFASEGSDARPEPVQLRTLGGEERPERPVLVRRPQRHWVVRADPGDWEGRYEAFWEVGTPLHEAGGKLDGFSWIVGGGGAAAEFAIPFRNADEPAFPPPWKRVERPPGRVVVVYPGPGAGLAERLAAARAAIVAFAEERGLELVGPMRAAPYVHVHDRAQIDVAAAAEREKPVCVQWDVR